MQQPQTGPVELLLLQLLQPTRTSWLRSESITEMWPLQQQQELRALAAEAATDTAVEAATAAAAAAEVEEEASEDAEAATASPRPRPRRNGPLPPPLRSSLQTLALKRRLPQLRLQWLPPLRLLRQPWLHWLLQ